jgi:replicative DNA helicase
MSYNQESRQAAQKATQDRYTGEYAEKDEWQVLATVAKEGPWFFAELQAAHVTAHSFLDSRAAFTWSCLSEHIAASRPMSEEAVIRSIDDRIAQDRIRSATNEKFKPSYLNQTGEGLTLILFHLHEYRVDVDTARFIGSRLVSRWRFRIAQKALTKLSADASTWTETPEKFVEHILATVHKIPSAADTGRGIKCVGEELKPYLDSLYLAYQEGKPATGLLTGFPKLDTTTNGLMPGDLAIVAAGSGVGKTSFAINVAAHVARSGGKVLIFSLEMTIEQIMKRLVFMTAQIDSSDYYQRKMNDEKWGQISRATEIMAAQNLFVVDDSNITLPQLHSIAQKHAFISGVDLIIVDYTQLLPSGESNRDGNREQEVRAVADGLKRLADDLRIPVMALSQVNDDGKTRESRAIKFNASHLWLLKVSDSQEGLDPDAGTKRYELFVEKGRDSASGGTIRMLYWGSQTRLGEEADVEDFGV